MKKVLFAWTGNQDMRAAEEVGAKSLGAICQAALTRNFDELVLLSDSPLEKRERFQEWLSSKQVNNIMMIPVDLGGNPNDYRAIYENAKQSVQDYLKQSKSKVELTFHLAPGTPAMATIWVILANSVFSAKLIHSSPERGVQDVDFPFDIAADYLPDFLKQKGEKISSQLNYEGPKSAEFEAIVHRSAVMKKQVERAKIIAPYPVPVLILGESGTGKELFAKAIHASSLRKGKCCSLNCAAMPVNLFESELFGHKKGTFTGATNDKPGLIEYAEGGTLFLDEIGEAPPDIQAKLLRVLQEKKFSRLGESIERDANIRIISATNRNLMNEIAERRFREDLFHRLAIGILHLPPLREREGDVSLLIDHFMELTNKENQSKYMEYKPKKLSASARSLLMLHTWPGNVRELSNTLMRAAIWTLGNTIDKQEIEDAIIPVAEGNQAGDSILERPLQEGFDLEKVIGEVEKHYLERAMKEAGNNKSKASKMLNFKSYQAMDVRLRKYNIDQQ